MKTFDSDSVESICSVLFIIILVLSAVVYPIHAATKQKAMEQKNNTCS